MQNLKVLISNLKKIKVKINLNMEKVLLDLENINKKINIKNIKQKNSHLIEMTNQIQTLKKNVNHFFKKQHKKINIKINTSVQPNSYLKLYPVKIKYILTRFNIKFNKLEDSYKNICDKEKEANRLVAHIVEVNNDKFSRMMDEPQILGVKHQSFLLNYLDKT